MLGDVLQSAQAPHFGRRGMQSVTQGLERDVRHNTVLVRDINHQKKVLTCLCNSLGAVDIEGALRALAHTRAMCLQAAQQLHQDSQACLPLSQQGARVPR